MDAYEDAVKALVMTPPAGVSGQSAQACFARKGSGSEAAAAARTELRSAGAHVPGCLPAACWLPPGFVWMHPSCMLGSFWLHLVAQLAAINVEEIFKYL